MEKRNVELTLEKAQEWYNKGGELREVALQAYKEEELRNITYDEICEHLFFDRYSYFTDSKGDVKGTILGECVMSYPNAASTERQLKKLMAINKLANVAKYLNDGWIPNWNNTNEFKYSISQDTTDNIFIENNVYRSNSEVVFKTYELAKDAIKILGENTIRLITNGKW